MLGWVLRADLVSLHWLELLIKDTQWGYLDLM